MTNTEILIPVNKGLNTHKKASIPWKTTTKNLQTKSHFWTIKNIYYLLLKWTIDQHLYYIYKEFFLQLIQLLAYSFKNH